MQTYVEMFAIAIFFTALTAIITIIVLSKKLKRDAMRRKREIESLNTPEEKIYYLLLTYKSLNRFEISSMANLSETETKKALNVLLEKGTIHKLPPLPEVAKEAGNDAEKYSRYALA